MKYLADANVLSETTKANPSPAVITWLDHHETELVVNPIILGELEHGILRLETGKRRTRLLSWFTAGIARLQVLDIDRETANIWARLLTDLRRKGRAMPLKDSLIAASALQHELTVTTRNTTDYRYTGVRLLNPFN